MLDFKEMGLYVDNTDSITNNNVDKNEEEK